MTPLEGPMQISFPVLESVEAGESPFLFTTALLDSSPRGLVAVIDSGCDITHPALLTSLWRNPRETRNNKDDDGNTFKDDLYGWNFHDGNNNLKDEAGHGTHVAGIVVQNGANVMIIKGFDFLGWDARVAAAVRYAVNNGARVVCMSLGSTEKRWPMMAAAIDRAQSKGALVVAAAGNSASDNRKVPVYPASLPDVLSVMALDGNRLWSNSNIGGSVAAPGKSIRSTLPGGIYGNYSGTSMACPCVAALASRLFVRYPNWTAKQIKERIINTADRVAGVLAINAGRALS